MNTSTQSATHVKVLEGFNGDARLFKLSVAVEYTEYKDGEERTRSVDHVVVSAVDAMFSGPETLIFPADSEGEVLRWIELPGSYKGGKDHAKALEGLGFIQ